MAVGLLSYSTLLKTLLSIATKGALKVPVPVKGAGAVFARNCDAR
jgi:hypothetical protein